MPSGMFSGRYRKCLAIPILIPRVFQKARSFVTVEDEEGSADSSPEIEIGTMCRYICVCTHIHRYTYIHIDRTPVNPQLHRLPATRRTNPFTSTNPHPVYHRRAQEQHGQPGGRRRKRNKGGGEFIPEPDGQREGRMGTTGKPREGTEETQRNGGPGQGQGKGRQ